METRAFLGLMSGTSCDGVDGALVEVRGSGLDMRARLVQFVSRPFDAGLRRDLLAGMAPAATRTETLARLHRRVGEAFAQVACAILDRSGAPGGEVAAIGSHGQTVCHLPPREPEGTGTTLQIGDPSILVARTGLPVIDDFRSADMAHGGQGAPLVPFPDLVLFHSDERSRAILNLGGIANVTYLPRGAGPGDVIAFDTGPGCMAIDALARLGSDGRAGMDRDGAGRSGTEREPRAARWTRSSSRRSSRSIRTSRWRPRSPRGARSSARGSPRLCEAASTRAADRRMTASPRPRGSRRARWPARSSATSRPAPTR